MTFNALQKDTERGIPNDHSGPTPSERFLLFRDLTFVCIILFHLASAILAIPTLVSPTPDTSAHLIVILVTGVLTPLLALVSYRDNIRTSKFTSAIWFEFAWTSTIALVDFTVAVSYSTIQDASKVMIGFAFVQTITMMVYILALGGLILLQHRSFPEASVWQLSVQSVQWLRSSVPIDPSHPPAPPRICITTGGKVQPIIPPWDHHYEDMHEIKLDEPKYATRPLSPEDNYVNAHPFWQARVQRQVVAEQDMAYIVQRYGLDVEANKMKPHFTKPNGSGHAKRPSIRGLEISRPVPIPSTVRRANTMTDPATDYPRRYKHQHTGSMDTWDRPVRRGPPASLRLQIPSTALDVPEDVVAIPTPAARVVYPNPATRSLGLASRTLVGTSRPKASATRAYVNTSKPLPSPPPYEGSDLSLPSSGPSQGSHFVMAMAHRVKISASKVRPLMVSTPTVAETPIKFEDEKSA